MPQGVEFRLVDETGRQVPRDISGSVQLRGPIVFQRYHNNETATKECTTADGWYDTGDLGTVDGEGNLSIVGRSKEIIIINGQNYSSFELEHCIETDQPQQVTATYTASFADWDEKNNTEGVVVVFNTAESDNSERLNTVLRGIEKSVIKFCRKTPLDILALPKTLLPKSTLGKLSRAKLKQQYKSGAFDQYKIPYYNLCNGIISNGRSNGNSNGVQGAKSSLPLGRSQDGSQSQGKGQNPSTPLTKMQKTIANILADETKVAVNILTPEYPMTHLGIDSLGYMRIKKALERAFEMEDTIPMSLLLQAGSVKELEDGLLSIGTVSPVYDPLVPLCSTGSKTPLWLLHPGSGEVLCWLTILKYLPDRPIYAIRAKGLHKSDGWFEDLDEMVT